MESGFLGVGWNFPVGVDGNGQIRMARYEESVRQAIWTILGTAKGERVMRPGFGCAIHDLVFAPTSAETVGRIGSAVREALVRWEPRIEVLDVSVATDATSPNRLLIQVNYAIRTTNSRFNLVYPFYLA